MNTIDEDRIIHFPQPPTLQGREWEMLEAHLAQAIADAEEARYQNDEVLTRLLTLQRFVNGMKERENNA